MKNPCSVLLLHVSSIYFRLISIFNPSCRHVPGYSVYETYQPFKRSTIGGVFYLVFSKVTRKQVGF